MEHDFALVDEFDVLVQSLEPFGEFRCLLCNYSPEMQLRKIRMS